MLASQLQWTGFKINRFSIGVAGTHHVIHIFPGNMCTHFVTAHIESGLVQPKVVTFRLIQNTEICYLPYMDLSIDLG